MFITCLGVRKFLKCPEEGAERLKPPMPNAGSLGLELEKPGMHEESILDDFCMSQMAGGEVVLVLFLSFTIASSYNKTDSEILSDV